MEEEIKKQAFFNVLNAANKSGTSITKQVIIAGPCSAETEEQVIEIAQQLKALNKVHLLRAGIWKPRTRPGSFEGVGVVGLPWMQKAKELTGLPTTVEVATGKQVENALSFGVDVLWVGARTTVNPFSVQEIADAVKGTNIPVLIKNPLNPDLELWQGAVERIAKAGCEHIGLIHRGFSSYGNTEYRNAPMWHLAIEMKRRFPHLIIINDPSHICGRRDTLQATIQTSIDLDFDGIILESHTDPDNAWSDAKQQITPEVFGKMLADLLWRSESTTEAEFINALAQMRSQINQVDDELLTLIGRRMKIADQIGEYKKANNITILQANRWNEILEMGYKKGEAFNLSKDFIDKYFDAIHMESIFHQNNMMNKK